MLDISFRLSTKKDVSIVKSDAVITNMQRHAVSFNKVLVDQCQRRGWEALCIPIEVAHSSLCRAYTLLGIKESHQVHRDGRREGLQMASDQEG